VLASRGSKVVEHSPRHLKVEGSSPVTTVGAGKREKDEKEEEKR